MPSADQVAEGRCRFSGTQRVTGIRPADIQPIGIQPTCIRLAGIQ
jgi:hypothetical protein